MSHFTKIKTKIIDKAVLFTVLKQLNCKIIETNSISQNIQGQKIKIEFFVELNPMHKIGFARGKDGSYDIIADWWGVDKDLKKSFIRNIMQNYSLEIISQEMKKKGYNIVEQKNIENNTIKVVLRKW